MISVTVSLQMLSVILQVIFSCHVYAKAIKLLMDLLVYVLPKGMENC